MYKLLKETSCILRFNDDGSQTSFAPDPANTNYQAYLTWLAEGNTPEPADEPIVSPPDPKMVGIEFQGVMCSATRDDQNGLIAVIIDYQLSGAAFKPTKFYFVNGNTLVLSKENLQPFLAVWKPFRKSFFEA
jgi:hypothetical protein